VKELINSHMNLNMIKRIITVNAISELNNISTPCYIPSIKKHLYELLRYSNINEKDLKEAVKRFWKNTKAKSWDLENDVYTNLLILLMYVYLKKRDIHTFKTIMLYFMIRQYANLMFHYFPKYCNESAFKYTLDNLTKTHIFYVKDTISSAVNYFSEQMVHRYRKDIEKYDDPDRISRFIRESRHRIAQSLRSFANAYYENEKKGLGISQVDDESEMFIDKLKSSTVIDTIVNNITLYRIFEKKIFYSACKATNVDAEKMKEIIVELMNPKYKNHLQLCYELFAKEIPNNASKICTSEFYTILKKMLSSKKTIRIITFKTEVTKLFDMLRVKIKDKEFFDGLSEDEHKMYVSCLSLYVMTIFRIHVCGF